MALCIETQRGIQNFLPSQLALLSFDQISANTEQFFRSSVTRMKVILFQDRENGELVKRELGNKSGAKKPSVLGGWL